MARDDEYVSRRGLTARQVRDLAALGLLLAGAAGLVACAFVHDRLLGFTVLSVVVLAAGVLLGYSADADSGDDTY